MVKKARQSRQYGAAPLPIRASSGGSTPYGQQGINEPKTKKEDPSPSTVVVLRFHKNADTDVRPESIHHTLGPQGSQASPGDHSHDAGTSKKLLKGYNLTGSKTTPSTMWPSIIICLVRLGATDNTTP